MTHRSRGPTALASLALPAMLALAPSTAPAQVLPAAPPAPAGVATASAPISDVRYEVTFNAATAARRRMQVAMRFGVAGSEPVLLSLPGWTPGAYEMSWFARWVQGFQATDADGRALGWDKVDHDTWRVRPSGRGEVTVRFDAVADSLDNAMAWSRADFLLFNGTTAFMYPEGRGFDWPSRVTIVTEPGWLVATGMPGAGAPRSYALRNYHDLVDMPTFVGKFDLDSAQVAGKWTRLATYPAGSVSGDRRTTTWDWIRRMIPPQVQVFGEVPWDTYTVLQVADPSYQGASGLEHQNSHVDVVTPLAVGNPFLASLYSHEIFHAWNVKRLRPAELVPYRYDAPQPTALLWVSEGITDYYADLALVRGGITTPEQFWEATSGKMEEVASAPAVALEDASLSTWVHPTDGSGYIYYPKGSLAGLLLDILIRDASDNRNSLDTVMRELYGSTYKRGQGFTAEQFWAAASRSANGRSFAEFATRYVDGRDPFPWAETLPLAGMRLQSDTTRDPRIGITSASAESGVTVTEIAPGSSAASAGVQPGDVLVSIADLPVTDETFGARFRQKFRIPDAARTFPIVVRRGEQTLTLTAPLQFVESVSSRIVVDEKANAKAVRIRRGIVGEGGARSGFRT